jgi:hypothetical protein
MSVSLFILCNLTGEKTKAPPSQEEYQAGQMDGFCLFNPSINPLGGCGNPDDLIK